MRISDWSSDVCSSDLARETIWLGTYIFDNDAVGQQFVAALSQAKSRGVQVKVLIDDTRARYSWPRIGRRLKQAGIDLARFNPLRLSPPALHPNLPNTRTLLLLDCGTGSTGGMN